MSAPISLVVGIHEIPSSGRRYQMNPGPEERRLLAETLGVLDLPELSAELEVRPVGEEVYAVRGQLAAKVVQTDVVTLDPVAQDVAEEIDLVLSPAEGMRSAETAPEEAEAGDVYRNGRIDLGAIVTEHLAVGLDPYPRAPGVEFMDRLETDSEPQSSPFAILEKLRPREE
jgi:uncharacterized metal-binding protein YceD (DUF177 family)